MIFKPKTKLTNTQIDAELERINKKWNEEWSEKGEYRIEERLNGKFRAYFSKSHGGGYLLVDNFQNTKTEALRAIKRWIKE